MGRSCERWSCGVARGVCNGCAGNGAIRVVKIDGQKVHAEGAGPLWVPGGGLVLVRFTV